MPLLHYHVAALLVTATIGWCGSVAEAADAESRDARTPATRVISRQQTTYGTPGADATEAEPLADAALPPIEETPVEQPTPAIDNTARRLQLSGKTSKASGSKPTSERSSELLSGIVKSSGTTAAAALAFVVGLFMLLTWLVKRGTPKSAQILPGEVVCMLGRVPLGNRQFGHLLKLGNKLVLVSVHATGVEKLAEIDDPQEVVRLLSMCDKKATAGSQKEFEEIFGQFAKERTESGFLGSETQLFTSSNTPDDYGRSAGSDRYA